MDDPADITEQTRLDLSRVLASVEFQDQQHPFPTPTRTRTPTPNPAPRPALPLKITFSAKTSQSGRIALADITIEIKDASGNPVNGAIVLMDRFSGGLSKDGRYTTQSSSNSSADRKVSVEVFWNQELIGKQDFMLSWK